MVGSIEAVVAAMATIVNLLESHITSVSAYVHTLPSEQVQVAWRRCRSSDEMKLDTREGKKEWRGMGNGNFDDAESGRLGRKRST